MRESNTPVPTRLRDRSATLVQLAVIAGAGCWVHAAASAAAVRPSGRVVAMSQVAAGSAAARDDAVAGADDGLRADPIWLGVATHYAFADDPSAPAEFETEEVETWPEDTGMEEAGEQSAGEDVPATDESWPEDTGTEEAGEQSAGEDVAATDEPWPEDAGMENAGEQAAGEDVAAAHEPAPEETGAEDVSAADQQDAVPEAGERAPESAAAGSDPQQGAGPPDSAPASVDDARPRASLADCPVLAADLAGVLRWEVIRVPERLFCRAIEQQTGREAFALSISREHPFRPRRADFVETSTVFGQEVRWYRGANSNELIREALIELNEDQAVHVFLRAENPQALAASLQMVSSLQLPP